MLFGQVAGVAGVAVVWLVWLGALALVACAMACALRVRGDASCRRAQLPPSAVPGLGHGSRLRSDLHRCTVDAGFTCLKYGFSKYSV